MIPEIGVKTILITIRTIATSTGSEAKDPTEDKETITSNYFDSIETGKLYHSYESEDDYLHRMFFQPKSFSENFKEAFGVTPQVYRKTAGISK